MTPSDGVSRTELDDSWKHLQQVNDMVRYADAKAGFVLTLNGVLVGLIAVRIQTGGFFRAHPGPAAALLLAMALLTVSVVLDIAAVMPRLSPAGKRSSLLHFDHIGERFAGRQTDYVDEFAGLFGDSARLQREIAAQVWANSMVARRKYQLIQAGLSFMAGALGAAAFAGIVGAFGG